MLFSLHAVSIFIGRHMYYKYMVELEQFDSQAFAEFAFNHHFFFMKRKSGKGSFRKGKSAREVCKKIMENLNGCSQPLFIIKFAGVKGERANINFIIPQKIWLLRPENKKRYFYHSYSCIQEFHVNDETDRNGAATIWTNLFNVMEPWVFNVYVLCKCDYSSKLIFF